MRHRLAIEHAKTLGDLRASGPAGHADVTRELRLARQAADEDLLDDATYHEGRARIAQERNAGHAALVGVYEDMLREAIHAH